MWGVRLEAGSVDGFIGLGDCGVFSPLVDRGTRVRCRVCGKEFYALGIRNHFRHRHPEEYWGEIYADGVWEKPPECFGEVVEVPHKVYDWMRGGI